MGIAGHFPVSRSIGQTLALDALESLGCPLLIVDAEADSIVIPEVKLGQVAMEVLFRAMLIDALHAPLEDREHVLDGVGVHVARTYSSAPWFTVS